MLFEPGFWYRHNGGQFMYIHPPVTSASGMWGTCFIGEDRDGYFSPVGIDSHDFAVNWNKLDRLSALVLLGRGPRQ